MFDLPAIACNVLLSIAASQRTDRSTNYKIWVAEQTMLRSRWRSAAANVVFIGLVSRREEVNASLYERLVQNAMSD
jgi:hypothetical protein